VIVLDANVLIAFLDGDDAHHRSAIELMATADRYRMHPLTVAEVLVKWVRERRLAEVEQLLDELGVTTHQLIARESVRLAELRASTGLKLPDCCPLLLAEVGGWPLATFDARLATAARSRGVEIVEEGP